MESSTQYLKRVQAERNIKAAVLRQQAEALTPGSPEHTAMTEKAAIFTALNRRAAGRMKGGTR